MPIGGTAFAGQDQSPRITTNYLNQLSRKGDPAPGVPVSTAQVSGSIVQPYAGQVGGVLTITNPWAPQFNDPAVGTYGGPGNVPPVAGSPLYGGLYQYVQFNPTDTVAAARGMICFWFDELNYIVTTQATATAKVAGIIINPDTPGNWDFIQIAGISRVQFGAAGGAIGNIVSVVRGIPGAASAASGAGTNVPDMNMLGTIVLVAAAANNLGTVELNILAGRNF